MTSTAELRRVFVDTSAWLVLMNRNERYHEAAVQFHRCLDPATVRVITWGILSETYTWLRYHSGYRAAERWLHEEAALESQGVLEVVFPTTAMETGIRRNLSRFQDQDLSYIDALSLYVVQSRGDIDAIFAFDHHLALTSVPVFPGPL
jgi:predicted nucleic acid-binding protein